VVEGLKVNSLGTVVKPGEPLMRIVPTGKELVAEVRLDRRDIGHVAAGDTASVKVSTYDPTTFGTIAGRVRQISAATFTTEDGVPYYRNGARPRQQPTQPRRPDAPAAGGHDRARRHRHQLKSVLGYLAKPVYRALSQSLGKR
jgi:HlyD family secretion protein/adhesin transport system membrane fusion protein